MMKPNFRYLRMAVTFTMIALLPSIIGAQDSPNVDQCDSQIVITKYDPAANIYSISADGSNERQLTNSDNGIYTGAYDPNWSPRGDRIVFSGGVSNPAASPGTSPYQSDIFVMDADGSFLERLTQAPSGERHPVFSPDGTRIAFVTGRDGNSEVYVMNSDGTDPINLTNSDGDEGRIGIAWSPDGTRIAFGTERGQAGDGVYEERQLYVMDGLDDTPNRTELRFTNLTEGVDICPADEFYSNPAWSNSGEMIAFALSCDELYDVYIMEVAQNGAASGDPINLTFEGEKTTTSDGLSGLSWSPDDRQIVYVSTSSDDPSFGEELMIVNVDERAPEGGVTQVTHYNSPELLISDPTWRPCSQESSSSP